jgi:tetratricopeptide (TPR) repeat protein
VAPEDLGALRGLMAAEVAAGDAEAALETLARLAAGDPEPVDPCPALELASRRRLERGDLAGSEQASRGGIKARCTGSDLRLARVLDEQAVVARSAGDLEAALALEREAIALDPGQPARFERAAELLLDEDRVEEAVTLLASGLEQHPEDRELRDLMVRALSIR